VTVEPTADGMAAITSLLVNLPGKQLFIKNKIKLAKEHIEIKLL
jgi:hypothetical protein